jgi:hypothetical protein
VVALPITMIQQPLGGMLVPMTGGALSSLMSRVAARVAAVHLPPITQAADVEDPIAEPAADLPEAVLHESPSERAENLSVLPGPWETARTSVCRRSPEGPGSDPGPSFFPRAAWERLLLAHLAQVNFPTARALPQRHDARAKKLRIGEAINTPSRPCGSHRSPH